MRLVVVNGIEADGVARAVDARTYARGLCSRSAAPSARRSGTTSAPRCMPTSATAAWCTRQPRYFAARRALLEFMFGECTCPVATNCAHVVASVLTAVGSSGDDVATEAHPPWERTLRTLFAPDPPSLDDLCEQVPLALELSLSSGRTGPVSLSARIVRPGRTGWVAGGLTWHSVSSHYSPGNFEPAHVRVLAELYALHNAGGRHGGYHYGGYDRTIDLTAVGRGLWSVLDEAGEVGLQLVHARKRFGAIDRYDHVELCLDVTAGPGPEALEIAPALRFDGADGADRDALPIVFLGAEGHGVVHVSRAQAEADPDPAHWRFRLARLVTPAPAPLRRLTVEDGGLSVPAKQRRRFLDEFYPGCADLPRWRRPTRRSPRRPWPRRSSFSEPNTRTATP